MNKSSSAYDIGQGVSLFLGGSGAVRATYMVGWRGVSALAANTNSRRLALSLSSARNAEKLISNPALLLDAAQRAKHVVPALERLRQQGGSIRSLMNQVGKTNAYYNRRLIPLTPFIGAASNDDWYYSRLIQ
jgi:hypothetical protein